MKINIAELRRNLIIGDNRTLGIVAVGDAANHDCYRTFTEGRGFVGKLLWSMHGSDLVGHNVRTSGMVKKEQVIVDGVISTVIETKNSVYLLVVDEDITVL